jgi:hypothetical protein
MQLLHKTGKKIENREILPKEGMLTALHQTVTGQFLAFQFILSQSTSSEMLH